MDKVPFYKKYLLFNKRYFLLAVLILLIEILIALYAHDRIIRPWFGDLLVVILIYCFVKAFLKLPIRPTAIAVLLFACCVEWLQYFKLVNLLHLEHSTIARIIIGTSFEWSDLLAYTMGIAIVLLFENKFSKSSLKKTKRY